MKRCTWLRGMFSHSLHPHSQSQSSCSVFPNLVLITKPFMRRVRWSGAGKNTKMCRAWDPLQRAREPPVWITAFFPEAECNNTAPFSYFSDTAATTTAVVNIFLHPTKVPQRSRAKCFNLKARKTLLMMFLKVGRGIPHGYMTYLCNACWVTNNMTNNMKC